MTWQADPKAWWTLPPGQEREALKQATAPQPKQLKPPRWRREKGPAWIRREPGWIESNFRRVEFTGGEADRLWAECKALCALFAPAACKPRINERGTLVLDYRGKTFIVPIISPSDTAFAIREMRFHDMQLERQCSET